ncbi:MAG TPA: hypothetical protein VF212_02725 [Longimicrobiales bacterium]
MPQTLPDDASSLLVPVHLDAWVVDSRNQQALARYRADFGRLAAFRSPVPDAFDDEDVSKPAVGIHLHWALPDALTHGREAEGGGPIEFPLVPNRWLIVRVETTEGAPQQARLWVVQSDFLGTVLGKTAVDVAGSAAELRLAAPGAAEALPAGTRLELAAADGSVIGSIVTSQPVSAGDVGIPVRTADLPPTVPAGTVVRVPGSSEYLDPYRPTTMQVEPGRPTTFTVRRTGLGRSYAIEAWEARADAGGTAPFLRAVGPGNIAFAAYAPFVQDVFSFTDAELPPEGSGVRTFSYTVVGWYAEPESADPLRSVERYVPGIWADEAEWRRQSPVERFQAILASHRWSVRGEIGAPPSTSLYHGTVVGVQWPYGSPGNAGIDERAVQVAVGATAPDALAALVQAAARREAKANPTDANAWLVAGDTLAELIQASLYDLLDRYGAPGGAAELRREKERARFGALPGGTVWEVVSAAPEPADGETERPRLTAAQAAALDRQLAALNRAQRELDAARRRLASGQAELHALWWKVGRANALGWGEEPSTTPPWSALKPFMEKQLYPALLSDVRDRYRAVNEAAARLPDPTDEAASAAWAEANWSLPAAEGGGTVPLSALGLKLKPGVCERFWHPTDPVVMVAGLRRARRHGEDGRHARDGTLVCRLPGQTIEGLSIDGQPPVTLAALEAAGVQVDPTGGAKYGGVPAVPRLLRECFLADLANAARIAPAIGADAEELRAAVAALLDGDAAGASWTGAPPAPFAIVRWAQAWAPLFLEWEVNFHPTGASAGGEHRFSPDDWRFDGEAWTWAGTGFDEAVFLAFKGRSLLTPHAQYLLREKLAEHLKDHPALDSAQLDALLDTVAGWDLLAQSLSGLTDQLVTRLSQETFLPSDAGAAPTAAELATDGAPPRPGVLMGDAYDAVPVLESPDPIDPFHPVRAGLLRFRRLRLVDAFGQTYDLVAPNSPQGFVPILGEGLMPTAPPPGLPAGMVQLAPRIVQPARLEIRFLSADGSGRDILTADRPNAVCGWLLPNWLDGGIAVYDAAGAPLGEVMPLPAPRNWRRRPGPAGGDPAPATVDEIANPVLRAVVASIAGRGPDVMRYLLRVVDETLGFVDPLGGRKDAFLSVLIGRPLAVVQAELSLGVYGEPYTSQLWNRMAEPDPSSPGGYRPVRDTGGLEAVSIPVRLGSLDLRHDGLIGYFLPDRGYDTFYAVHPAPDAGDGYIRPITARAEDGTVRYQGDIVLKCQAPGTVVTLLLDPRGAVHAYTGILPVSRVALPGAQVEAFLQRLELTFRAGPVIAGAGTFRMPRPAAREGRWSWLQPTDPDGGWEEDPVVDAADTGRLPDGRARLRDGWLRYVLAADDAGS